MKNIRIFYPKNCNFLVVKFSVYLDRLIFVMNSEYSHETIHCKFSSGSTWFVKPFCWSVELKKLMH